MIKQNTATTDDIMIMQVIQDLMQMTCDGFERLEGRMDGLEGRMDGLEGRMGRLEGRLDGLEGRVIRIEGRLDTIEAIQIRQGKDIEDIKGTAHRIEDEQAAQRNDIAEILDRIVELEHKVEKSDVERQEMSDKLERVIEWAFKVASAEDIPLKIPSAKSVRQ